MNAKRHEHIETSPAEQQEVSEEERLLIGDLGNEFDDPDELLTERSNYWRDLAQAQMPTRQTLLRHRLVEAWSALRAVGRSRDHLAPEARVPEEVWIRLFEDEVGPTSPNPAVTDASPTAAQSDSSSAATAGGARAQDAESAVPAVKGRPVRFALDRERTGLNEPHFASDRLPPQLGATG